MTDLMTYFMLSVLPMPIPATVAQRDSGKETGRNRKTNHANGDKARGRSKPDGSKKLVRLQADVPEPVRRFLRTKSFLTRLTLGQYIVALITKFDGYDSNAMALLEP